MYYRRYWWRFWTISSSISIII